MAVLVIPVILNVEFILDLWLVDVPEYAVVFTQIMLIEASFESMSTPIAAANQATGKIKYYQMIIGILGMMNLPVSYIALKLGANAEMVYIISLVLQSAIVLHRALYLRKIREGIGILVIGKIYLPCIITGTIAFLICYYLYISNSPANLFNTLLTCVYEALIVVALGYLMILNKDERAFVKRFLLKKF